MKAIVIIDMQNDFITGSLANPAAQEIAPKIRDFVNDMQKDTNDHVMIFATMDTHYAETYDDTQEGCKLPVKHCCADTKGWQICDELKDIDYDRVFRKQTFGELRIAEYFMDSICDEVYLCGTCTDICVISNAIMIRNVVPFIEVSVISDLCAGTTKENHENALKAMAQCQINIKTTNDLI